jgi:trimeric autotransporter adhesin
MKKITLLLLTVACALLSSAQTTSTSNVLGTTGITAINSTTNAAFKLSINGTQKNYGTGDGTGLAATMVISPTIFLQNTTAATGKMYSINANNAGLFRISDAVGTTTFTAIDRFVINPTGFIGIGNSLPTARLHVTSSGITSATNALLVNNSANTNLLTVRDDGNVGIGITTPTSQLHTTGGVKFAGLALNTAAPRVLASDANGLLSYRDATSFIADGSETKLAAGANISVSGTGTTVSPYLIAATIPVNTSWDLNGNANATATSFLGTPLGIDIDLVFMRNGISAGRITSPLSSANTSFGLNANPNSTGTKNTTIGLSSLQNNITGISNTAIGVSSLQNNTSGSNNTSIGVQSLQNNTIGIWNSGFAVNTLAKNTTGNFNTATGVNALVFNITGSWNSSLGVAALQNNTDGNYNSALGYSSLTGNTIGNYNTALGFNSNVGVNNLINATAIGAHAYVSQSNSLILGSISGVNSATANTSVGIGTTSPAAQLHTTGTVKFAGLTMNTTATRVVVSDVDGNIAYKDATSYWNISALGTNNIVNNNIGGVIIGSSITTLSPGYKLYVQDGILTEKLKIRLRTNWPDYVFNNDYPLQPLSEIENFIKLNKHLPGIPSAEHVKQEGIEVGETNALLLKKIEELTLYLINTDKEIKALQKKVTELDKKD